MAEIPGPKTKYVRSWEQKVVCRNIGLMQGSGLIAAPATRMEVTIVIDMPEQTKGNITPGDIVNAIESTIDGKSVDVGLHIPRPNDWATDTEPRKLIFEVNDNDPSNHN